MKYSINQYINTEVKEFARYTVYHRAVPNVIDGLKPSQRKILYTAIKYAKNSKMKIAALSGMVIAKANYHHGDKSLNDATTLMASDWKNNCPILDYEGNLGSRLINQAAAARYPFVKLSKYFDKYFLDNEVLDRQVDPEDPEPLFYLPTIPWVLLNGVTGMATGFATNILPRSLDDLLEATANSIKGISTPYILPTLPDFKGVVRRVGDKKYKVFGTIERQSPTKFKITEIPPGTEREAYMEVLENLKGEGEIVRYVDKCNVKGFGFDIVLSNKLKDLSDAQLLSKFSLIKTRGFTENLTVILEDGSLHVFDNVGELIDHFVSVRLTYYTKRYEKYIADAKDKIDWLMARYLFIEEVMKLDLTKMTRAKFKNILKKKAYCKYPKLLDIKIYAFNKDELNQTKNLIKETQIQIKKWEEVDIKKEYLKDLGQ